MSTGKGLRIRPTYKFDIKFREIEIYRNLKKYSVSVSENYRSL